MASTKHMNGKVTPPIETKIAMDKDYDYYVAKYNSQPPPPPPPPRNNNKYQGNLGVVPMEPVMEQMPMGTPPRPSSVTPNDTPPRTREGTVDPEGATLEDENIDGDEALLDLAQLEELHQEAERMKALGNKHMAAQEYSRAYNAYSAALQLSPVGPSSHVFLSNRSAALLSLKRYSAAATDARRAVALAPTFGKAHARLGQALYFLKDYEGAVTAYEDAIHYEPDNPITQTYLEKAKIKLERQRDKAVRAQRGEEMSVLTEGSSVQATVINSVATDPNASAAVVQTMGFRSQSHAMSKAVGRALSQTPSIAEALIDEDDPDFDEALRIQERANRYLANKNYKFAIEEYTAALFLVPDDDNLSPDLHLGRAHALNGSRRHESARIDAQLAIKIKPTPEAYSTLAKSLFYMKDYHGAIDCFGKCRHMLPEGEMLSMFDRAYLQKSEAALQEALQSGQPISPPKSAQTSSSTPIPKLKPPRFVPREEALNRTPNMPAMPSEWPQQSPRAAHAMQCGPERDVLFLSEALGIKLNRGPDGIVRVVDVSPEVPGSPIARQGKIEVGDVIREAAGVDIRRPITNIMWGDTVALIKMAPRPIVLVVAKEMNLAPFIAEQRKQAAANALSPTTAAHFFPSNSSGDESVKRQLEKISPETAEGAQEVVSQTAVNDAPLENSTTEVVEPDVASDSDGPRLSIPELGDSAKEDNAPNLEVPTSDEGKEFAQDNEVGEGSETDPVQAGSETVSAQDRSEIEPAQDGPDIVPAQDGSETAPGKDGADTVPAQDGSETALAKDGPETVLAQDEEFSDQPTPSKTIESKTEPAVARAQDQTASTIDTKTPDLSSRDEDKKSVAAEIFFERKPNPNYNGWDNLRWMSYAGMRKVRYCEPVSRFVAGRRTLFWSGDQHVARMLAIYDEPNLILILRAPESLAELREIMDMPVGATLEDPGMAYKSYLVVESVIDPKTCKLRLSPLTAATSILVDVKDEDLRRRSCFELINPVESVILSAVRLLTGAERALTSFTDSRAFLETSSAEHALQKSICDSNKPSHDARNLADLSWKHQIILGTLHSFVVLGNQSFLDMAIDAVFANAQVGDTSKSEYLDPRIVDAVDESGRTPLHYACSGRFSSAVQSLVNAGANVDLRTEPYDMTPCHIAARSLDDKSLAAILAVNRRANVVDSWGRTPIYLAISEGRAVGGQRNPEALERCLAILEAHGGEMEGPVDFRNPVSHLAAAWNCEELAVVLKHLNYRYPLILPNADDKKRIGMSVSAFYQYPVHSCLVTLRKKIKAACEGGDVQELRSDCVEANSKLIKTLQILFSCGFEPNERLEGLLENFDGFDELAMHVGFAPIQILGAAALDVSSHKEQLGDALYMGLMGFIANTVEMMVKNGARVSLEQPPAMRSTHRNSSSMADSSTGSEEGNEDVKPVDRSQLKIQSNKQLAELIGVLRLNSAEMIWNSEKSVKSPGNFIFHTDKLAIEDSEAPGGSDDKSCALCWKIFGTIMNRKHRCRVSRRHVCDECSSKRIIDEAGEEHRVGDGLFLLVRTDRGRAVEAAEEKTRQGKQQETATAARLGRLEAEEKAKRDSLFGGVMGNMAKAVFGGETEEAQQESQSESIGGLSSQLNQTRDALNERGEKLNTLADKSDKLVNASRDFASMAKELNKQSNQGFFW